MSTIGDGTSGTAVQQAAGLLGSEVREGYAEIGDVRLHYVEAGEGPLIVLLHGFPEFWYGWRLQIKPLAAAGLPERGAAVTEAHRSQPAARRLLCPCPAS
jgi:hypothetical protein